MNHEFQTIRCPLCPPYQRAAHLITLAKTLSLIGRFYNRSPTIKHAESSLSSIKIVMHMVPHDSERPGLATSSVYVICLLVSLSNHKNDSGCSSRNYWSSIPLVMKQLAFVCTHLCLSVVSRWYVFIFQVALWWYVHNIFHSDSDHVVVRKFNYSTGLE
jgi:hypothetical protein